MDAAKAKAAEAVEKAKVAAGMAPRDWETGICGCFDDFGGCESAARHATPRYVISLARRPSADPQHPWRLLAGCMGLFCPCIVANSVAPEADQSPILCCLGSLSVYPVYFGVPVFLLTGCLLRQNYREKKNIDGGCPDDFLCGGVCHTLNLCQMAREINGAGSSGVARMER
jgi:Cys-rich protein (TIGR01571 family)